MIRTGSDGGPIVRKPKPANLANSAGLLLQFMVVTFSQVLELRAAVEPEIARVAALHRTSEQGEDLGRRSATAAAGEAVSHFRWYRSYIERRYPTLLDRPVRWTPT